MKKISVLVVLFMLRTSLFAQFNVGTSVSGQTDVFGNTTTVHKDSYGNKTGSSTSSKTDIFGNTTTTHKDAYGNTTGRSTTGEKDIFGNTTTKQDSENSNTNIWTW